METSTVDYNPFQTPEETEAQEQQLAEFEALGEKMEADEQQLLAGKFETAEDLERAYIELQAAFSGRKQNEAPTSEAETEESAEEVDNEVDNEQPDEATQALFNEIQEYGQLTQETVDEIGEPAAKAIEALYSQQAGSQLSDAEVSQLQGVVGGPEAYQSMIQWAAQNLQPGEIQAYDRVMNSGNVEAIYWAMKGLYSNYQDAVGYDGEMIQGKAPSTVGEVFRSQAEVVRAMQDPRYENDPAYRQDVFDKLERSNIEF
jgi:hypothetical protein